MDCSLYRTGLKKSKTRADNKQLWKCKPLSMDTLGDRCKRSLCKSLNMHKDESDLEDSY